MLCACRNPDGTERYKVEEKMTNLKFGAFGAAGVALMLTVATASAQNVTRIRGTIEKVDGNTLTVKSRDGANLTIKLKDGAQVTGVAKAALADIKQKSFIGITAMPQPDGTQKAIEVHIFPEARRGAGEGHRPWDLVPNSTMTNANVEQLVTAVDGPMLTMKYKDGEKKISVPTNAIIVQFVNADKADLKPGAKIFINGVDRAVRRQPRGRRHRCRQGWHRPADVRRTPVGLRLRRSILGVSAGPVPAIHAFLAAPSQARR